jgi:tRNA pseudouridine38-40 synthase
MPRIKCTVAYDGSQFSGYQIQPGKRTVQGEIDKALYKLHKDRTIKSVAAGRTDSGVHAKGQVIHFDSPFKMEPYRWQTALNTWLPTDIAVAEVETTHSEFHARYHSIGKEYRYVVYLSQERDPFQRNYAFQYPYGLNYIAMKEAMKYLIGTHDFTSFCSVKTTVESRVRTLREIEFFEENGLLTFRFIGDGFLYNMVRILVGTLLDVGNGRINPYEIPAILEKKDRFHAGQTAPGNGLYLWKVFYEESNQHNISK